MQKKRIFEDKKSLTVDRGGFSLPIGRPAFAETLRAGRLKSPLPHETEGLRTDLLL
jgi:hypothetical protein